MLRRLLLPLATALLVPAAGRAEVKLHPLFGDNAVLQRDLPLRVFGFAAPGEDVTVELTGGKTAAAGTAKAGDDGRWLVTLPKVETGPTYTLTARGAGNEQRANNLVAGEVWVCSGQSNMEWSLRQTHKGQEAAAKAANPKVRLFTVPKHPALTPQAVCHASWLPCTPQNAAGFSAVGYYFGRDLQAALDVPVGLIHTSWGGTVCEAWTSKEALAAKPELKQLADNGERQLQAQAKSLNAYLDQVEKYVAAARKLVAEGKDVPPVPQPGQRNPNVPTTLYNGMIAPIYNYSVRGAIWYQGESNAGRAHQYRTLLPTMIEDWRARWQNPDLSFFIVQLAPFMKIAKEPTESQWAELREAQLLTALNVPKCGLAVITDVGEENDIHPQKKEPVGARLALLARKVTYGQPVTASGPVYKSMKVEGNRAVLSFDHVGAGLEARDGKLTGFTVAGEDKKFHNAEAQIVGDTVVVSSPQVERPAAVRYGWANFPVVNLWNKDGLPASPFRTDDFPTLTGPKKAS